MLNLFTFFFLYGFLPSVQQDGIRVDISHLRNNKGHVLVSLFKDGAGYPDDPGKAIRKSSLEIREKRATVFFEGLPAGKYAVAILHDENDDKVMNKTVLGLPREGYGFSNNVMGVFGPPSFSRASFTYTKGRVTVAAIRTRY